MKKPSKRRILDWLAWSEHEGAVFPEPFFSGGQLTPSFKNRGSIKIFEGQLDLTPST